KALAFLESLGDVQVVEERWTRDGAIWSSAGVSAGMDMALAFIAELAGEAAASTTQLNAEYFPDGRIYGDAVEKAVRTPTYFKTLRR
ncbi:MAG: hypothetical protein MRY64_04390, partial [Hyphomonadaceae bacterium]|nr:hypothetical protein [Hyphomonadaceae bacterium]